VSPVWGGDCPPAVLSPPARARTGASGSLRKVPDCDLGSDLGYLCVTVSHSSVPGISLLLLRSCLGAASDTCGCSVCCAGRRSLSSAGTREGGRALLCSAPKAGQGQTVCLCVCECVASVLPVRVCDRETERERKRVRVCLCGRVRVAGSAWQSVLRGSGRGAGWVCGVCGGLDGCVCARMCLYVLGYLLVLSVEAVQPLPNSPNSTNQPAPAAEAA
jgi:hypothetical protein